jgi:thiol:disulfide interchange protein
MLRYAAALRALAFAVLALAATVAAQAQTPKVQAELIAPLDAIEPGVPFKVGLSQQITPHWHTYWKNPGDSGESTRVTWTLPEGFTASDIRWPVPNAIPVGPLMNYGYSDALLLPVTITPPREIAGDSVRLTAHADWLVCEKICVPESADLDLTLPVTRSGAPAPSPHADRFAQAERMIPSPSHWRAAVEKSKDSLTLRIDAPELKPDRITDVTFFPDAWGEIEHAAPQKVEWTDEGLVLRLKPGELAASMTGLDGVLVLTEVLGDTSSRNAFAIRADVADTPASQPAAEPEPAITLLQAMLFALLGGLILNLMPCVLPILSLKALSLASHGGRAGHEAAVSGLAYVAGVLVSFAALAVVLAALRSAGLAFGWGFQFQSPVFVLAMAALFLALALSLSGVFDIGGGAVGLGERLTQKAGHAGSFFTGVLATIAATPCTAPFMGAAVGFALTRPALEMALVLQAMGLGFALPVLALSVSPGVRGLLPRPGPWMETLKQVLAFPLYATVAWLVWVLSLQTGSDGVLSAGVTLTAVGFAAWLLGSGTRRPWLRATVAVILAGGAIAATAPLLNSNSSGVAAVTSETSDSVSAGSFSEAKVAALRAEGRPVFVNLTAAWCISCKVNERVALSSDGFRKALAEYNVAYLKGDWTSQNDAITRVLKAHGRAGVPLYLLYPADPRQDPVVLPQLLTEAIVVSHIAALPRPQAAIR